MSASIISFKGSLDKLSLHLVRYFTDCEIIKISENKILAKGMSCSELRKKINLEIDDETKIETIEDASDDEVLDSLNDGYMTASVILGGTKELKSNCKEEDIEYEALSKAIFESCLSSKSQLSAQDPFNFLKSQCFLISSFFVASLVVFIFSLL